MSYESGVLSLIKRLVKGSKLTKAEMDGNFTDIETAMADRYTKAAVDSALSGKATSSHTHAWSEITGKPSTFAPATHTHSIGQVSGLTSTLADMDTEIIERGRVRFQGAVGGGGVVLEVAKLGLLIIKANGSVGNVEIELDRNTITREVLVIFTNPSGNTCTITPGSGENFEGNSSVILSVNREKKHFYFTGTGDPEVFIS